MFETKRTLRRRIEQLESDLEYLKRQNRVSGVIESSKLPKCKSMACAGCQKAVFHLDAYGWVLVGCGADSFCKDYLPNTVPIEEARRLIQEDLCQQ